MSLKALKYEEKLSTYFYLKRRAKVQKCEQMRSYRTAVADTYQKLSQTVHTRYNLCDKQSALSTLKETSQAGAFNAQTDSFLSTLPHRRRNLKMSLNGYFKWKSIKGEEFEDLKTRNKLKLTSIDCVHKSSLSFLHSSVNSTLEYFCTYL